MYFLSKCIRINSIKCCYFNIYNPSSQSGLNSCLLCCSCFKNELDWRHFDLPPPAVAADRCNFSQSLTRTKAQAAVSPRVHQRVPLFYACWLKDSGSPDKARIYCVNNDVTQKISCNYRQSKVWEEEHHAMQWCGDGQDSHAWFELEPKQHKDVKCQISL